MRPGSQIKWHVFYLVTGFFLLWADHATKIMALERLSGGRVFEIIPGFFDFSLAFNTGAAFGLGRNWPEWLRNTVFLGLSSVAVVGIAYLNFYYRRSLWLVRLSVILMLTGAVGNLIDRYRHGYVVDFIHFYYQRWHYPNFNVADSCICVGVTLFVIYSFWFEKK